MKGASRRLRDEVIVVRVQCPHCRRTYRTELEAFGRTAVCTKCNAAFRIGDSRPPFQFKPTGLAEDSWIGVEVPEQKPEARHCIHCDALLEPGGATCPACGINQVTGVRERPAVRPSSEPVEIPLSSRIPVRAILVFVLAIGAAFGLYRGFRALTRSVDTIGDELTDRTLVAQAARYLRDRHEGALLPDAYAGRVTDANLPRFLQQLSAAGDPVVRRAIARMIGLGRITQLAPVVAMAESRDTASLGMQVLEAVGIRRLVELARHDDPAIRQSAARALCLASHAKCDEATIRRLAEPTDFAAKAQVVNAVCGTWPQGTGQFAVVIQGTPSPFRVMVEQFGRTFLLRVGAAEFASSFIAGAARFEIPIERWCAATGTAADAESVGELMAGVLTLGPVVGGWEGTVRVTARRSLGRGVPGFLPVGPLDAGRPVEAPVRLAR